MDILIVEICFDYHLTKDSQYLWLSIQVDQGQDERNLLLLLFLLLQQGPLNKNHNSVQSDLVPLVGKDILNVEYNCCFK